MGHAANAAKYGAIVNHFYWLAAMPAMCFVGVFMMPFYYGSKVRSVPEFLKKRYNEKTRTLNALSFAVLTILVAGIDLYAMAILFQRMLNWPFWSSVVASAAIVAVYIYLGGLTSSIYNEVLQFFLIVFGFLPLAFLGLREVGGFAGLEAKLPNAGYAHTWANIWSPSQNPMGVDWFGLIFGLGFVLSFGYWCTDFLVVQRAMAAKDMAAAERTPLIAAVPKMLFPFIIILPGLIAISVPESTQLLGQRPDGSVMYDNAIPALLGRYYPSGLLGIGLTALLASFMSGMAGNVTAFNTVWTYDIYQTHINPGKPDSHYLKMGKFATVFAVGMGIATAFIVLQFETLMDYLQLLFAFFNAPLFATFVLGMFWKRATPNAAFAGLLLGILGAMTHYSLYSPKFFGVITYASDMTANFYQAIWAFSICFVVTVVGSFFTQPRKDEELVGLVYALTPKPKTDHLPWYDRPGFLALAILGICTILNIIFW
jgi:SSS family solute:Na+ symporter